MRSWGLSWWAVSDLEEILCWMVDGNAVWLQSISLNLYLAVDALKPLRRPTGLTQRYSIVICSFLNWFQAVHSITRNHTTLKEKQSPDCRTTPFQMNWSLQICCHPVLSAWGWLDSKAKRVTWNNRLDKSTDTRVSWTGLTVPWENDVLAVILNTLIRE